MFLADDGIVTGTDLQKKVSAAFDLHAGISLLGHADGGYAVCVCVPLRILLPIMHADFLFTSLSTGRKEK